MRLLVTTLMFFVFFARSLSANPVPGETGLTPNCNKTIQMGAIQKALDSAIADRFRDELTGNPHAKWIKKRWKNPGDLWAFVAKKKWIRFRIDGNHSLRELRPNAYLLTVEVTRHRNSVKHEGPLESVSYEFVIIREKDTCKVKEVKPVDLRRS